MAPIDEFTFVDLGAGMGRAMLLASEYPFRAVLEVEINATLARIARKNAAHWRAAGRAAGSVADPLRGCCGVYFSRRALPGIPFLIRLARQ